MIELENFYNESNWKKFRQLFEDKIENDRSNLNDDLTNLLNGNKEIADVIFHFYLQKVA